MQTDQTAQTAQRYDAIGLGYASFRRPDPRIERQIWSAVGDADKIVNVGAGTGSYERSDRSMIAVEPSVVMVNQRAAGVPVVRASAESLPFPDNSFDVALALMTVHHWDDPRRGLNELRRVAPRQVVFTYDPEAHDKLWVFEEYVPATYDLPEQAPLELVVEALGAHTVETVPTPADCADGFASAYWRRPQRYLSPEVRTTISAFARLDQTVVEAGMDRLARDLSSGAWQRRHADLLQQEVLDGGLRLVVAGPPPMARGADK